MVMLPKKKRIKLSVGQKIALRKAIFERDHNNCVICGKKAEHWHHHPFGSAKSDEINKGVALCGDCHNKLHNDPKLCSKYQKIVSDYLEKLYGNKNKSN